MKAELEVKKPEAQFKASQALYIVGRLVGLKEPRSSQPTAVAGGRGPRGGDWGSQRSGRAT